RYLVRGRACGPVDGGDDAGGVGIELGNGLPDRGSAGLGRVSDGNFAQSRCQIIELGPGVQIAVGGDEVAAAAGRFDGVVVFLLAAEIAGGKGSFRSLVDVVDAPVLAVDVEMIHSAVASFLAL